MQHGTQLNILIHFGKAQKKLSASVELPTNVEGTSDPKSNANIVKDYFKVESSLPDLKKNI